MSGSISLEPSKLQLELCRRGWQAIDLARKASVSPATVTAALQAKPLKVRTLYKIAKALSDAPGLAEVDSLLSE